MAKKRKFWQRSHRDVNLYFEGYEKFIRTDPVTGKRKTEYRYTGDYYLFRLEEKQVFRYKILCTLLILFGTALFLAASLKGPSGSIKLYMALPALVSLIPLCYLLMGLWSFLRWGSPKMTIREYIFGLGRMKNSLWVVMLLWIVTLAAHLFYIFINRDFSGLEFGCAAMEAAAAAAFIFAQRIQEKFLSSCIHEAKSEYISRSEKLEQNKDKGEGL